MSSAIAPDAVPQFPFYIDVPGLEVWVLHMPDEHVESPTDEAWVDWQNEEGRRVPQISMRDYDERVLLHEVLHVALGRAEGVIDEWIAARSAGTSDVFRAEEGIVRAMTQALWGMGWRWKIRDRHPAALERERLRAYDARERMLAVADEESALAHEGHEGPRQECVEGACGMYAKLLVAARQ